MLNAYYTLSKNTKSIFNIQPVINWLHAKYIVLVFKQVSGTYFIYTFECPYHDWKWYAYTGWLRVQLPSYLQHFLVWQKWFNYNKQKYTYL